MLREFMDKRIVSVLDRVAEVQAPLVEHYAGWVRDAHRGESTAQVRGRLERHYLVAVTASGVVVGLSAAVPGIGTLVGLAASGADALLFIEASTVLALGAATIEKGALEARRGHLVSSIVLGDAGTQALGQAGRSAKHWETALANKIPVLSSMDDSTFKRFLTQFLVKRGALMFGKVIPAGVGAVVGGIGNYTLGRSVIGNLHEALEPDPTPAVTVN
ncbi:hypothetical protein [Nocardia callitridis]|uniref:EcsC family protein n=1 Tax=Nocardia callitridis TaxID=648753 RepID=A0ABP9JVE0_9NOCA